MKLGGTVVGSWNTPAEWEELLIKSRFKAVTAPFNCYTAREDIEAYCEICRKHDVTIAEIGVWKNPMDPNPEVAAAALAYAKGQLKLADELGIPCCVNIVGTSSAVAWDAADPSNYTEETYQRIIDGVRDIIDSVNPTNTYYCIEPMPWMIPDDPDVYLQLIKDVDREHFAAHMDFVNMICSPRRYLGSTAFIEDCFAKLAPYIKSTHIKDSHMDLQAFTTLLTECSPGEGELDYEAILRIVDKYLPKNAPVLLEHMNTAEEYAAAYDYVSAAAQRVNIEV